MSEEAPTRRYLFWVSPNFADDRIVRFWLERICAPDPSHVQLWMYATHGRDMVWEWAWRKGVAIVFTNIVPNPMVIDLPFEGAVLLADDQDVEAIKEEDEVMDAYHIPTAVTILPTTEGRFID